MTLSIGLTKSCLRCGQCCKEDNIECPHLSHINKRTYCKKWKERNISIRKYGYFLADPYHICVERKNDLRDFPDCPLNNYKKICV